MQPIGIASSSLSKYSLFVGGITPEAVLSVFITIVFIWWAIFTAVVVYHWFRYARDSWVAVPAIAVHFAVSAWIFVFATGGLH